MHGPAPHSAKIMVVFGTRPEAIKMFPVVRALQARPELDVRICLTGQHRAMLDQVLNIAGIVPDIDLALMQPGQPMDQLFARMVTELGAAFETAQPDRIVVHGDTLTALAASFAAYFRRIPVAHVEAGLRSGNIYHPWPEEVSRRVTAVVADMHFAPTEAAAAALIRENIDPGRIWVTGNSVIDALLHTRAALKKRPSLAAGLDGIAHRFAGQRILAVTAHRRESFGQGMQNIAAALASLAQTRSDLAIVFPLHPNPAVRPLMESALSGIPNIALTDPLDYPHFVRLLDMATLVLTDSGGVQEEAPALGKPVLVMRETTERPEGIKAGTARLVGAETGSIITHVLDLLDDAAAYEAMARAHNPYGTGKAAEKIAEIVAHAG